MKGTKLFVKYILLSFAVMIFISSSLPSANAASVPECVYFFGDSTTAHLSLRGGIPRERVLTGPDSTVKFSAVNREKCVKMADGSIVTLAEAAERIKPEILVITLGVSGGAGFLGEEDFKAIYRKMLLSVREASPNTVIIAQSILPLSDKSVKYYKKITKEKVVEANGWIKEVCASLSVKYINTHDLLTDTSGYLKKEYQNDEYMHLTAAAYEVILNNIGRAVKNIIKE